MIKIKTIEFLGDYGLRVWFSDGTVGDRDFAGLVLENGVMVEPLKDKTYFSRAFVEAGALCWPNGFDIAPAWLYQAIRSAGQLRQAARV